MAEDRHPAHANRERHVPVLLSGSGKHRCVLLHVGSEYETMGAYTGIGNARLQGLTTQLNLTGNKFNIAIVSSKDISSRG